MIPPILSRLGLMAGGFALLASLAACSSILPGKAAAPDVYKLPAGTLAAPSANTASAPGIQLVVDMPIAARALDTDRIAVRSDDYELAYLSGARWDDSAPRVVQQRLIETFEAADLASGVGRAEDGMRSDLGFVTDLRAFEVETHALAAPVVNVRIAAKLVTRPLGDVQASQIFEAKVKAASSRDRDIIAAFDKALNSVGGEATQWVRSIELKDDVTRSSSEPHPGSN